MIKIPPPAFARDARQSEDDRELNPPYQYDSGLLSRKPSEVPIKSPTAPAATSRCAACMRGAYLNGKQTESVPLARAAADAVSNAEPRSFASGFSTITCLP